jgi:methylisocitrate lyase
MNVPLSLPGGHDALSAKMIENYGFKALQVSGFGLSASYLGLPDMRSFLLPMCCIFEERDRCRAYSVIVDADTGSAMPYRPCTLTEQFIGAGAAGMKIEDQAFPKRCGHMEGKQLVRKRKWR